MGIRNNFFTPRIFKYHNGLPRSEVESSLKVFNKYVDVVFREVTVLASPPDSMIFEVFPNLSESMNLQFHVSVSWTRPSFSQGAVRTVLVSGVM